jgi:hypothetical protein
MNHSIQILISSGEADGVLRNKPPIHRIIVTNPVIIEPRFLVPFPCGVGIILLKIKIGLKEDFTKSTKLTKPPSKALE